MKTGRNDPCPCGSGKKYKKCCLDKDLEESSRRAAMTTPVAPLYPMAAGPIAQSDVANPPVPPPPPDPVRQRADSRWQEFNAQEGGGRMAVFLETIEDIDVMDDDLAFEMLGVLHSDAVQSGNRTRFAECVGALRERRPEVFAEGGHFYLSWCLLDALAENRHEVVPSLARELAQRAERDIDIFNHAVDALAFHGQLNVLVESLRVAWPFVKASDNIVPWGVSEFAEKGADHEIFYYLESTASPDPADAVLLDRVRFFIEDPREEYLCESIEDLTGKSVRQWQADDFKLTPPRKRRREDWDAEDDESETSDPGVKNLYRLISEFIGDLRRRQGVPFPRGEMIRQELYHYFLRRNAGDLDPRPGMLEQALHPNRKRPKPPRPAHPLCPDRVTFDVYLSRMLGMLSDRHYPAAALFQAIPAWLIFLESHRLIDADTSRKVAAELRPLHTTLLEIWKKHIDDPQLYCQGQTWPG